jgi:multisubunit Na+/H+ antiporter MnhB subunit
MRTKSIFNVLVLCTLSFFGFILIYSTLRNYSSSLTSTIATYYLEHLSLTGALNAVVAILLDFRAYDTLGEILVIFVTISGITMLIRRKT